MARKKQSDEPELAYSKLDMAHDPEAVSGRISRELTDQYDEVPKGFKKLGAQWYPRVKTATKRGVSQALGGRDLRGRKLHPLAGPGLVASVSPNMDWEKGNINALGEMAGLSTRQWSIISDSAKQGEEQRGMNKEAVAAGRDPKSLNPAGRNPRAYALLKGMDLAKAPDSNLVKAHRILQGEHPEEVITAPKTYAFMHNIDGNPHYVTVDGRAHDMAVNQLQPWKTDRGIGSARLKSGKTTRYETIESGYKQATEYINARDVKTGQRTVLQPHHLQAILWEYGKHMETMGVTKAGTPREKGIARTGQAYFPERPSLVAPPRLVTPAPRRLATPPAGESIGTQGLVSASSPMPVVGRSRAQRRSR